MEGGAVSAIVAGTGTPQGGVISPAFPADIVVG